MDRDGPRILGARPALDVARILEPVDEAHRARRRQAEHAPQAVERRLAEELIQCGERYRRRLGLARRVADRLGGAIGDGQRQRAEQVAGAIELRHPTS